MDKQVYLHKKLLEIIVLFGRAWLNTGFLGRIDLLGFNRFNRFTQMDHASASSEILLHGLPSKSERPSIRKPMALSLSSQLIVLVFTKQPSAERYLTDIFL